MRLDCDGTTCAACVSQTGDADEKGDSSPPPKRSCPADGGSRRVTFNPHLQERVLHQESSPVTLKEAADIVVRYLDPFYTQGKFATKVGGGVSFNRLGQVTWKLCTRLLICSPSPLCLDAGAVQGLRPLLVSPSRGGAESGERPR